MTNYNKLLIEESPLVILPSLAVAVGLNGAVISQQIHFWLKRSPNERDGYLWVYKTYEEWQQEFPWWSVPTIKRAMTELEKIGLVISTSKYNQYKIDKTKWYRLDYEKFAALQNETIPPQPTGKSGRKKNATDQNDSTTDQIDPTDGSDAAKMKEPRQINVSTTDQIDPTDGSKWDVDRIKMTHRSDQIDPTNNHRLLTKNYNNNNNHNPAGENDPDLQPIKTEEPKPENPKQPEPKEDAFSVYEQITSLPLTTRLFENIKDAIEFYGEELTIACFKHAGDSATRAVSWAFVQSIFDEWRANGVQTIEQARTYVKGQRKRKQQQAQPRHSYGRGSGRVEVLPEWFKADKEKKAAAEAAAGDDDFDFEAERAALEAELKARDLPPLSDDFEAKKEKLQAELKARKEENRQAGNS